MSAVDLVSLVCCDLAAVVRGRSIPVAELDAHRRGGVGWVPANQSITPFGTIATPNPFGPLEDLRLRPAPDAHVRVAGAPGDSALELVLCDIVETDGRPGDCCPRNYLREALDALEGQLGARLVATFEHEFQLPSDEPRAGPFSLEAQRRAEPFGSLLMGALVEAGVEPELFLPEYGAHQFELPIAPAIGMIAADRSVVLKEVVREVACRVGRRATFAPLLDLAGSGNGAHVHFSLIDADDRPLLYDGAREAGLSALGGSFAAGVLRHARALTALTAPSPASAGRLTPNRWSAGASCLGHRNREVLLRIPPIVALSGGDPARQLHLEYRGGDATANPYLALGSIVRAGLAGVLDGLPTPPILERDPAELGTDERVRYGVGALPTSLEESLEALAADATVRGWMSPRLYDAYVGIKRAEIDAVAGLDAGEVCRLYAAIY